MFLKRKFIYCSQYYKFWNFTYSFYVQLRSRLNEIVFWGGGGDKVYAEMMSVCVNSLAYVHGTVG